MVQVVQAPHTANRAEQAMSLDFKDAYVDGPDYWILEKSWLGTRCPK
jgi:hypothetical protein